MNKKIKKVKCWTLTQSGKLLGGDEIKLWTKQPEMLGLEAFGLKIIEVTLTYPINSN